MEFAEQKELIISNMGYGDRKAIAKRSGISIPTVWKALKKTSVNDMSPTEKAAWIASVEFINNRLNSIEKIEQRTAKVAERI